jgi:hypothetical protein
LKAPGKPEHPLECIALFTKCQAAFKGQAGRHQLRLVLFLAKLPGGAISELSLYLCFPQSGSGVILLSLKSERKGVANP